MLVRYGIRAVFLVVISFFMVAFSLAQGLKKAPPSKMEGPERVFRWDFEDVSIGSIPPGWKVEATGRGRPLAAWKVVKDTTSPSGEKVLALVQVNHHSGGTFNLCWTDKVSFLDGTIAVAFKAVSGKIDEGGGIMWRVRDRNNYYVVRFNPLEDNFRIYYVKNGRRRMIGTARVSLPAGTWHTMRVVATGDRYACFLDGRKYLEGRDGHFKEAGGVGLWTKADAMTSFDDFKVVLRDGK